MSHEFEQSVLRELKEIKAVVKELHTLNKNIESLVEKITLLIREKEGRD